MTRFLFFSDGASYPYVGGRSKDDFIKEVNKFTGPATTMVDNCEAMKDLVQAEKLALTYFGNFEGKNYDLYTELAKAAKNPENRGVYNLQDYVFFHTTDTNCASLYGADEQGMGITRTFDESPLKVTDTDFESAAQFLSSNA